MYVGTERPSTDPSYGFGVDGKVRSVISSHIGVSGKARKWYPKLPVKIEPLKIPKWSITSAHSKNYAFISHNSSGSNYVMEAYNKDLIQFLPPISGLPDGSGGISSSFNSSFINAGSHTGDRNYVLFPDYKSNYYILAWRDDLTLSARLKTYDTNFPSIRGSYIGNYAYYLGKNYSSSSKTYVNRNFVISNDLIRSNISSPYPEYNSIDPLDYQMVKM